MRPTLARFRRVTLEVERKFACFSDTNTILRNNLGDPPFRNLIYLGQQSLNDSYYDKNNILSSHGIWIRKRNGDWQAKVRNGGDYQHSRFEELEGQAQIRLLMNKYNLSSGLEEADFNLTTIAKFVTTRDKWKADDAFEIALDRTDFGHAVGEVELQYEANTEAESIQNLTNSMDAEIEAFMEKYRWAFTPGLAVGKLSAYFSQMTMVKE